MTHQQPENQYSSRGGSSRVEENTNQVNQESWLGTDRTDVSDGNTAWGAIIAGVFTFLSLAVILALGAMALGLQDAGGWALGLWTFIGLAVAFLAAGYVTGALAVRAGAVNGFLMWAVSLIAVLFLTGWMGTSIIGGVSTALGNAADTAAQAVSVDPNQAGNAAQDAANTVQENVDEQDVQQAQQQASELADEAAQTAQDVAPQVGAGIWWTLLGLVVGAVLSVLAGSAGSRSVMTKRSELTTANTR